MYHNAARFTHHSHVIATLVIYIVWWCIFFFLCAPSKTLGVKVTKSKFSKLSPPPRGCTTLFPHPCWLSSVKVFAQQPMNKDRGGGEMMHVWNLYSNLLMHMQVELLEAGAGVAACAHAAAALLPRSPSLSGSAVTGSPCVTAQLRRSARPYTAIL